MSGRELDALLLIGRYRFLSQGQLEEFLLAQSKLQPASKQVIGRRIVGRLRTRGLIDATVRLVGGPGGGSSRLAYFLTPKGAKTMAEFEPNAPSRRQAVRGSFLMRHGLMTADVALAFQRSARCTVGHSVLEWECDWETAQRLGSGFVVPDARLVYGTPRAHVHAFVEVDLGTESTSFFCRKVERYLALYSDGTWRQHLRVWPIVLTITPDDRRSAALHAAVTAMLARHYEGYAKRTEFDFCSLADLVGPIGPCGAIWRVAGRSGRQPLVPLPAGSPAASPADDAAAP